MTLLATIAHHDIWVFCDCGHQAAIAVDPLLGAGKADWTVERVRAASRCSACGRRGPRETRIVWAGQSNASH